MTDQPRVILSGFADEAANHNTALEQFVALAALGLQYYTLRHIDAGAGVKNVLKLTVAEIQKIRQLENEYGLNVASIGSPIGKVKLLDVDDGTKRAFVPFKKYLAGDVAKACELAHAFETKLIRGFSFYPPKGSDPRLHLAQVVDQLGQIAEAVHRSDLTLGVEVDTDLLGRDGRSLAEIYQQVNHPAMVLVFDAGNLLSQGYSPAAVFEQYLAMKPGLGWMHIKDYRHQPSVGPAHAAAVESSPPPSADQPFMPADHHFVPADQGDAMHEAILRDFSRVLPALEKKLSRRGIPGVFLDLEPHLKGAGPFGGVSGPDGMGVAMRGLCRTLDYVGIDYHLRDLADIRAARGMC
jgi:sugar phosphate isomerase/epimerase